MESTVLTKYNKRKIITKVKVQGQKVTHKNHVKYLGFCLDRGLTFDKHITDRVAKSQEC